jgi:hypothetical protein
MRIIDFFKRQAFRVSDAFARSDANSLGNAETGQTWLQSTADAWSVGSGKAYFRNTNDAYFYLPAIPNTFTLSYVFTAAAGGYWGPRIRLCKGAGGSYRLSHCRASDGVTGYLCLGSDGGTSRELAENIACASGSAMRVEVTREGANVRIKIYDDGVLIVNALDSTFRFEGNEINFGFGVANASSTFDNILIE